MRFHAAAPPGEWLNDPNGLLLGPDGWTLFAQHRTDAPGFKATGWARLTSPDGLRWAFRGPAIPAADGDWAYSGCVARDGDGLLAFHTRHTDGLESQLLRRSADGGATWSEATPIAGPPARNRRDPWVTREAKGWTMLLARPCPWEGWEDAPPSRLDVLAAPAPAGPWGPAGSISLDLPPGVMGEVPVLLPRADGRDDILVSTLDRRRGRADGAVLRWTGRAGDGFASDGAPVRLDHGPDFYAAVASTDDPSLIVGWASSWTTARHVDWGGAHGGPISLPRRLTPDGLGLDPAIAAAFARPSAGPLACGKAVADIAGDVRITVASPKGRVTVSIAGGHLHVERDGLAPFDWSHAAPIAPHAQRTLTLFLDGPLAELHIAPDDRWVTAASTCGPLSATLEGQGGPLRWFHPPD